MFQQPTPSAPRNLVLCFDGTGDWIGADQTNVAKLFTLLDESPDLCYYDGGIGTLIDYNAVSIPRRMLLRLLDLANGTSLREKVLQGYRFLVRTYRPGDRIYLFGFSRGAYTARIVAALVQSFGILRPSAENIAPYLWQAFITPGGFDTFKAGATKLRERFALSEPVTIRFMGLFDTVSSVGLVSRFNVYPFTAYNPGVERTCHAVSIDESCNMFPENLMDPEQPDLTEVWFPGVHRDAGGGLLPARARIADETLHWMALEAQRAGLRLLPWKQPDPACPPVPNHASFDPYVMFGTVPLQIPTSDVAGKRYYWPNFRSERPVPEQALIHEIALQVYDGGSGRPLNFPQSFVLYRTGSEARSSSGALKQGKPRSKASPWLHEIVVIVFGIVLLVHIWDILMTLIPNDYRSSRHGIEVLLLLLIVPLQGIGRAAVDRLPRGLRFEPTRLFPWSMAIVMLAMLAFNRHNPSPLLGTSLVLGFTVVALAKLGSLPPLRANRTLPYYLVGALACLAFAEGWGFTAGWFHHNDISVESVVSVGFAFFLMSSAFVLRDRLRMRDCALGEGKQGAARPGS